MAAKGSGSLFMKKLHRSKTDNVNKQRCSPPCLRCHLIWCKVGALGACRLSASSASNGFRRFFCWEEGRGRGRGTLTLLGGEVVEWSGGRFGV